MDKDDSFLISLIIPVFNESQTITELVTTIKKQSCQPAEIILVDGGSTDNTVQLLKNIIGKENGYRIIEAGRAMPGKARNIGTENANFEWIAYTDAGIVLDKDWLFHLQKKTKDTPEPDFIYGNFSPQINNMFEKCATIVYVPPLRPGSIRTKSIASCLFKKKIWQQVGGFPDWRAAEDLIFMERVEEQGTLVVTEPAAMMYWQLRPDLISTFKKFDLYSKYNVWAGRQAFWHYGIAKQYAVILLFIFLGILHSWYWLLLLPVWLMARAIKRIASHRFEFGWKPLYNPVAFLLIIIITLTIDAATFSGWIKALLQKDGYRKVSME